MSGARKTRLWGAYSPTAELTNSRKQRQEAINDKADRFDHPFFSSLLELGASSGDAEFPVWPN